MGYDSANPTAYAELMRLVEGFQTPPPGERFERNDRLIRRVHNELVKLPEDEREQFICAYGYAYRLATGQESSPSRQSA